MKPKPFFTLAIYMGIVASSALFAHEAYSQTYSKPECFNFQYVEKMGKFQIEANPSISIKNVRNSSLNITYTFRMCTEDGYCAREFTKTHEIPAGNNYQHNYRISQWVKYDRYGDYHYTVSVDIAGDINEHTEKTCGIHIRKND